MGYMTSKIWWYGITILVWYGMVLQYWYGMVWYGITILLKAEQRNGKSGLMDGRKACVDGLLMHLHHPGQEI